MCCREALYLHGGVLCITSRILVVDLLKKLCPVDKVAGILVCSAHRCATTPLTPSHPHTLTPSHAVLLFPSGRVTDSSTEAFILRLFRQGNKVSAHNVVLTPHWKVLRN